MNTGKIKWFSSKKGYGFIQPNGGGDDVFVHYSSIQMDGYRSLSDGDPVQYEVVDCPKGLQARNVQRGEI
jgi:cold shock protein